MDPSDHSLVAGSYGRCQQDSGFVPRLYEHLLASHPSIPAFFENTEFPRQYKLLQHGLGLLLSYAKRPDPELLDRIAARHSARGLNVPPGMYELFVASLMKAVEEHDPEFDADVDAAWRSMLEPGIDFMRSRYGP